MSTLRALTGEDLAGEVYDLICQRLPQLPADDYLRPVLAEVLPVLGDALGRQRLRPAPEAC